MTGENNTKITHESDTDMTTKNNTEMTSENNMDLQSAGNAKDAAGDGQTAAGAQQIPAVTLPSEFLFETDVHMDTGVLYDYMLRHTYTSPMGLIATLLGILAILFYAKGAGVLYLIMGILMIVYLPWNLFLSARKQALTNESFKRPLHYTFTDDGVYVSQEETVQFLAWADMQKAISTSKSIILYSSKVNAWVFPRKDLGDHTATVIQIISTHMAPGKVRIRQ